MDVDKRPKYLPRIQVEAFFMVAVEEKEVNVYLRLSQR